MAFYLKSSDKQPGKRWEQPLPRLADRKKADVDNVMSAELI